MHIPRIYQPIPLAIQTEISLDAWGIQHVKALRLREKDSLIIFNGEGKDYQGKINSLTAKTVGVKLFSEYPVATEPTLKIHLLQAISRGERMDYTIQKATELGVTSITPIQSERCEVKLPIERWQKRLKHWQNIAISACEQAGRTYIPTIHFPQPWSYILEPINGLALILEPTEARTLKDLNSTQIQTEKTILILIGPEGGFTAAEIEHAKQNGFQGLRLGPRILRTETAAPALLAALHARWGDLQ